MVVIGQMLGHSEPMLEEPEPDEQNEYGGDQEQQTCFSNRCHKKGHNQVEDHYDENYGEEGKVREEKEAPACPNPMTG